MAVDEIVARKHWFAYLRILLGYGIWLLILFVALVAATSGASRSNPSYESQSTHVLVAMVVLVVIAISLFFFLWSWMDTKRFTWTAEEDGVVRRCGWMPWQRSTFTYPYDTIFEVYYADNILGHYLGYSDITIRRTEGVTSNTVAIRMKNGKEMVRAIEQGIKEAKALQHIASAPMMISEAPHAGSDKSQTEQLRELAALKADGTITAEEFELMKRKIIQA